MKIHDVAQGSVEWMQLRAGIPTASEFHQFMTTSFEPRKGAMWDSYINRKVAERWLGGPIATFSSYDMDQGRILEEEALPWFELEYGGEVKRVGFITTDDGKVGCSPDGLLLDEIGIEIKCPLAHTHVGYLRADVIPPDYRAQVYGSLWVTDLPLWRFVSYCRRFPALILAAVPTPEDMEMIGDTVTLMCDAIDREFARMVQRNGGPPARVDLGQLARSIGPEPIANDITP